MKCAQIYDFLALPFPLSSVVGNLSRNKMGGIGAVAEPFVVVCLLAGGAWINRNSSPGLRRRPQDRRRISEDDLELGEETVFETEGLIGTSDSRSSSPSLLPEQEPYFRTRILRIFGVQKQVTTPNTRRFKGYLLSRLLEKFPFLVECWYWALIYWVCASNRFSNYTNFG